ncbi:hypothetical protein ABET52_06040 [Saccharococcus caldoxylosilyticus]|uniref:hypothetical protein n=1 Tax=Saccharococcus caldoxylosilyticus TaxID=81408 RepID=UPI003D3338F1
MTKLDSIHETEAGKNNYPQIKESLLKRFGVESLYDIRWKDIFESCYSHGGYATHTYTGVLKEGVEINEIELAMILDRGYSFFGGESSISEDRSFKVKIWVD